MRSTVLRPSPVRKLLPVLCGWFPFCLLWLVTFLTRGPRMPPLRQQIIYAFMEKSCFSCGHLFQREYIRIAREFEIAFVVAVFCPLCRTRSETIVMKPGENVHAQD